MKRPQKLAVMLVPTPPYEICGLRTLHPSRGLHTDRTLESLIFAKW